MPDGQKQIPTPDQVLGKKQIPTPDQVLKKKEGGVSVSSNGQSPSKGFTDADQQAAFQRLGIQTPQDAIKQRYVEALGRANKELYSHDDILENDLRNTKLSLKTQAQLDKFATSPRIDNTNINRNVPVIAGFNDQKENPLHVDISPQEITDYNKSVRENPVLSRKHLQQVANLNPQKKGQIESDMYFIDAKDRLDNDPSKNEKIQDNLQKLKDGDLTYDIVNRRLVKPEGFFASIKTGWNEKEKLYETYEKLHKVDNDAALISDMNEELFNQDQDEPIGVPKNLLGQLGSMIGSTPPVPLLGGAAAGRIAPQAAPFVMAALGAGNFKMLGEAAGFKTAYKEAIAQGMNEFDALQLAKKQGKEEGNIDAAMGAVFSFLGGRAVPKELPKLTLSQEFKNSVIGTLKTAGEGGGLMGLGQLYKNYEAQSNGIDRDLGDNVKEQIGAGAIFGGAVKILTHGTGLTIRGLEHIKKGLRENPEHIDAAIGEQVLSGEIKPEEAPALKEKIISILQPKEVKKPEIVELLKAPEKVLEKAVEDGEVMGVGALAAKQAAQSPETARQFLKEVADQALNKVASEATTEGVDSVQMAKELYGESIVERAIKEFPKEEPKEPTDFGNKSILNRLYNSEKIKPEAKSAFEQKGLKYEPTSHEAARESAKGIIDEFGDKDAVTLAESGKFHGDVNSMIFAEALDRAYAEEQKATTPEAKQAAAEKWADFAIRYDEAARSQGRFISAINAFYKKSPIGVQLAERAKRDQAFKEWFQGREKNYKEVFDEISKLPEFEEFVKGKVDEEIGKSKIVVKSEKRRKDINDFFDKAKFKGDAMYSTPIPPQLINGAIEAVKQAVLAGEAIATAVEKGIAHIDEQIKEWDREKFKKEWTDKLKGLLEPKSKLESFKERLKSQIESLNKQIDEGKRKRKQPNDLELDDEAKSLVEERDSLRSILNEIDPIEKKPLSDEQKISIAKKAIEKSIAEYERRINEADYSPKSKNELKSAELTELRNKRDELRKEYEFLKKETKKPTDAELDALAKEKVLNRSRKKLSGMNDRQKEEIMRRSFKELVENGALEYDDFKKIIADTLGMGELSPEQKSKIENYVKDMNAVEIAEKKAIESEKTEDVNEYYKVKLKSEKSATELAAILYNKPNIINRLTSIMQLNTLTFTSLLKNPSYNVFYQMTQRFPEAFVNSVLDQVWYGAGKLVGKEIKPDYNVFLPEVQKEWFNKFILGGKESLKQLITGTTSMDYFQKEIHAQQIRPLESVKDLIKYKNGEINLSNLQVADKVIQATLGLQAEATARALTVGDKSFRFAAEGAVAAMEANRLGLNGKQRELFIAFPKAMAKKQFLAKGMSEEKAMEHAEVVERRIIQSGEQAVFQQDNLINSLLSGVGQKWDNYFDGQGVGSAAMRGVGKALGTIMMPFRKIPLNAAWSLINIAVPEIAIVQGSYYAAKAVRGFAKGHAAARLDLISAKKWLVTAGIGLGIRGLVSWLVNNDVIIGSEDKDEDKRERDTKKLYSRPSSINMSKLMRLVSGGSAEDREGDLLVDNSWMGNFGAMANMQYNLRKNLKPNERDEIMKPFEHIQERLGLAAYESIDKGVFSGYMAGLNAYLNNNSGSFVGSLGTQGENMLLNILQSGTFSQWSRAEIPYEYKIKGDSFAEELQNNLAARSGLYRKLTGHYPPAAVSIWGDKIERHTPVFLQMLGMKKLEKDNFAQPLWEDFKKSGNLRLFPSAVSSKLQLGGETIPLNAKESLEYQRLVGQSRKKLVAPFVNGGARIAIAEENGIKYKSYDDLNYEQKEKYLQMLYNQGLQDGKDKFLAVHPELQPEQQSIIKKKLQSAANKINSTQLKNK